MGHPATETLSPLLVDETLGSSKLGFGKTIVLVQLNFRCQPELGDPALNPNMDVRRFNAVAGREEHPQPAYAANLGHTPDDSHGSMVRARNR